MLSEDVLIPLHNGPVLTITQIIKNVMSSASEAELAGLVTIAKKWSHCNKLSSKWYGHNSKLPSNATTQHQ